MQTHHLLHIRKAWFVQLIGSLFTHSNKILGLAIWVNHVISSMMMQAVWCYWHSQINTGKYRQYVFYKKGSFHLKVRQVKGDIGYTLYSLWGLVQRQVGICSCQPKNTCNKENYWVIKKYQAKNCDWQYCLKSLNPDLRWRGCQNWIPSQNEKQRRSNRDQETQWVSSWLAYLNLVKIVLWEKIKRLG